MIILTANTLRVAIISNRNFPGDLVRNLADHLVWMAKAKAEGARLILFPELSLCGYSFEPIVKDSALSLSSRECLAISERAASLNIYVAFGLALATDNKIYISHVLTGPNGIEGHYEKVHLAYSHSEEGLVFSPGSEFRVFNVDGISVGIMICFDGRFPASLLCLSHIGAEIVLHPHANYTGELGRDPVDWSEKKLYYLGPAAYDNCVYSLMGNSIGSVTSQSGKIYEFCGGGMVIGPDGKSVVRSLKRTKRPFMLVCDLDIEWLRKLRSDPLTYFTLRRPKIYIKALSQ
jgi:predicted amidohydrolase